MIDKYIPFIILVTLFVIFNLYILTKKILFLKRTVPTTGVVKKVGSESSDNGASVYFQNIEFNTVQGNTFTVSSAMGSGSDKDTEGNIVNILYNPDDPKDAVINDFKNIWAFESIVLLIGSIGLFVYFSEI